MAAASFAILGPRHRTGSFPHHAKKRRPPFVFRFRSGGVSGMRAPHHAGSDQSGRPVAASRRGRTARTDPAKRVGPRTRVSGTPARQRTADRRCERGGRRTGRASGPHARGDGGRRRRDLPSGVSSRPVYRPCRFLAQDRAPVAAGRLQLRGQRHQAGAFGARQIRHSALVLFVAAGPGAGRGAAVHARGAGQRPRGIPARGRLRALFSPGHAPLRGARGQARRCGHLSRPLREMRPVPLGPARRAACKTIICRWSPTSRGSRSAS